MTYWHYSCRHSAESIAETGILRPNAQPMLARLPMTWFTTQRTAPRAALGLTSVTLDCNRMECLYRVVDEDEHLVVRWGDLKMAPDFAPYLTGARRLEAARGTKPGLWAVALQPVRVERLL